MITILARGWRRRGLSAVMAIGAGLTVPVAYGQAFRTEPAAQTEATPDTTADSGGTVVPFPFYFYTPETESGFGALVAYYFRPEGTPRDRPSTLRAIFIYTTKQQASLLVEAEMYLSKGGARVRAACGASEFPDTFWGVGNDTPERLEEDFTPRGLVGFVAYEHRLARGWYAGPIVRAAYREIVEREVGGLIDAGAVPGTADGRVVSAGVGLTWDTRDDSVYPRSGMLHLAEAGVADGALGSDYAYASFSLSSATYLSTVGGHVLALRASAEATTATPPFDLLPGLGGDTRLRGYYAGRYRDRNLVALQAEYRLQVWRRLGMALFAAAGQVAHDADAFRTDGFHGAGGLGIRFLVSRAEGLNIRADLGVGEGEENSGFYLGIGEAF